MSRGGDSAAKCCADPDLTMDFPEGSLKVRELANGLNEGAIPPEAKERGQKEVERY